MVGGVRFGGELQVVLVHLSIFPADSVGLVGSDSFTGAVWGEELVIFAERG